MPELGDRLEEARLTFGRHVRRARRIAGMTQDSLAARSGVSQSVISRLERGKAPRLSLERLLRLHAVLGDAFPLGACPHDHGCIWPKMAATASAPRSRTGLAALDELRRSDIYQLLMAASVREAQAKARAAAMQQVPDAPTGQGPADERADRPADEHAERPADEHADRPADEHAGGGRSGRSDRGLPGRDDSLAIFPWD